MYSLRFCMQSVGAKRHYCLWKARLWALLNRKHGESRGNRIEYMSEKKLLALALATCRLPVINTMKSSNNSRKYNMITLGRLIFNAAYTIQPMLYALAGFMNHVTQNGRAKWDRSFFWLVRIGFTGSRLNPQPHAAYLRFSSEKTSVFAT